MWGQCSCIAMKQNMLPILFSKLRHELSSWQIIKLVDEWLSSDNSKLLFSARRFSSSIGLTDGQMKSQDAYVMVIGMEKCVAQNRREGPSFPDSVSNDVALVFFQNFNSDRYRQMMTNDRDEGSSSC